MQVKRVLVTGAAGFIGRWSVPELKRLGYEVHAVLSARAGSVFPEQLRGAKLHFADLLAESSAEELLGVVQPTHLLHFAWIATPGVYAISADNFRWVSASERLLRAFRRHGGRRATMAGSCAEYDWSRVEVCDEESSPLAGEEAAPYAICKIALQKSAADFSRQEQLSMAWGRIFFQFGPHEHPDRLVPSVIRNLLQGREAAMSHGRQVRSFLHVADVAAAFVALLDGDLEGPVNIGSDERIALGDLVDRIGRRIGRPELVRLGVRAAVPHEPMLLVPEIRRLRDEAGWRPRLTLDEALNDAIEWWRCTLAERPPALGP